MKKKLTNCVVPFDKKNTIALADFIHSEKDGKVSFLRLCDGSLVDTSGKKPTHCAVGEAYFSFINNNVQKSMSEISDDYKSKYNIDIDGTTAAVIDQLIDKAVMKNSRKKQELAEALVKAVEENDDGEYCGSNNEEDLARSERVARVFREKVAPLLK